ncbi:uncharacterized protein LOC117099983 [Anneissia japonica]|uniref:uncharacterized protein LOC117099983 n=1 Tax=Anneissia japonica TaxID=1529436 RepID=UPI0014257B0D|nr:uncharacterized protein LOC117099983 [Anneissia japonica]
MTRSSTTTGSCQSCRDLEQCFVEKPSGCNVWSPEICPSNLVNPNYADPERKNNIEISEKVQVINVSQNSTNIYICPVKRNDKVLLISSKKLEMTEASNILVSCQAQGIFHTVVSIQHLWRHSVIMASVARLDEVFKYASLNDVLDVIPITDYSDLPEESFWSDAINTKLSYPSTDVVLLQDVPFNKCLGRIHILGTRKYHSTFVVLTSDIATSYDIEVGDVLVVNSTGHFIESVVEIGGEPNSTFIETSILDCSHEAIRNSVMLTPPSSVLHENANIILGCSGGENNTDGIVIIDGDISEESLQIDTSTLIIGRETSGLVGKILHYEVRGNYVFIEVLVARDHQEFSEIISNEGDDDGINNYDSQVDVSLNKPLIYTDDDVLCEIDPQFQFNSSLRLIFSTDRIKYKQLDVIYEGPIKTGLHINCSAGVPFDDNVARQFAVNRRTGNYYVSLGGLKIPLSVDLKAKYSIIAGLPAPLETKFGVTSTAELNIGYGIRPQEERPVVLTPMVSDGVTSSSRVIKSHLSNYTNIHISINGTFAPTLTVTFPAEPALPFCYTASLLPDWLASFVGGNTHTMCSEVPDGDAPFGFQFSTTFEIRSNLTVFLCDEICIEEERLPYDITHALLLYGGLSQIYMEATYNQVYPSKTSYQSTKPFDLAVNTRECSAHPFLNVPNCLTGQTSEPAVNDTESVTCPDSTTRFQHDATIHCPCNCADGTVREMSEDGSCPCSCQCADGSYDTIAVDGSCPCECKCLDCMTSTLGPDGCECPVIYDICPPCLVGEIQVFDKCICQCVPVDQCGILPTCVVGRRGDYCNQLDCRPCQGMVA